MTPDAEQASAADAYDAVADVYAETYNDELARKPFDRDVLTAYAAELEGPGLVADIGCGPGQVTRFLASLGMGGRGLEPLGFDLSPKMVLLAQRLNPDHRFEVADVRALPLPDGSLAGAVAFYSLIHVPRGEVVAALTEIHRTLCPGSLLLISFHIGEGVTHLDTWFEMPVSLNFAFFGLEEMKEYGEEAGFTVELVQVRSAYPFEVQTERAYIQLRSSKG